MILLQLFFEFFKTGLFALGGGMATVPFLFDISARTQWFTANELANMIAVGESTPGPIGVNMATYVGFHTAGVLGSVIATLGLITPSIIIILIIAKLLSKFAENPIVKTVFKYLRPAVMGLLLFALYQVASVVFVVNSSIQVLSILAFAVLLFCMLKWKKVHPIVWIAVGAVFGLIAL
ncbi:MAG: chromate transporter [Sphaerochaetaceae bacterium]|nr:chromate transporter [Sphaerochaetaceae bacterium]